MKSKIMKKIVAMEIMKKTMLIQKGKKNQVKKFYYYKKK